MASSMTPAHNRAFSFDVGAMPGLELISSSHGFKSCDRMKSAPYNSNAFFLVSGTSRVVRRVLMTASFMAGYVRSSQVVTSPIILQRYCLKSSLVIKLLSGSSLERFPLR
ncbi:hypothetical protein NP493_859g00004 [Ridgeia piscesae]|uniref:Uncharacterized protein n=1 Tax=Ridgeia piscesae TaxID=27915 RepID=A0AAD9KNF0_RIDPI|nr:hypothetical protein NP493_859g00004 [Ridgeia piscesae]